MDKEEAMDNPTIDQGTTPSMIIEGDPLREDLRKDIRVGIVVAVMNEKTSSTNKVRTSLYHEGQIRRTNIPGTVPNAGIGEDPAAAMRDSTDIFALERHLEKGHDAYITLEKAM